MDSSFATVAMSTPTIVLDYAAAFFFVVLGIAGLYAAVKFGKVLERVDKVLTDVDTEGVPLMKKAGTTLDGVNANLGNVDQITKDVADITDKIDNMANVVEGAVSTPARKAAAFGAGVQGAFSSFMQRDKGAAEAGSSSTADGGAASSAPAADAAQAAAASASSAASAAGDAASDAASAAAAAASDSSDAATEAVGDSGKAAAEAASDTKG